LEIDFRPSFGNSVLLSFSSDAGQKPASLLNAELLFDTLELPHIELLIKRCCLRFGGSQTFAEWA